MKKLKKFFFRYSLGLLRFIFTIPILETYLLKRIEGRKSGFWLAMIPTEGFYSKNTIRKVSRNEIYYELDLSNLIENQIYFHQYKHTFKFIEQEINQAKIIFDIGANIGATVLFFAKCNPTAQIHAFEPDSFLFKKAKKNIDLNGFNNIHLHNFGLGKSKHQAKLYLLDKHNLGMNRIFSKPNPYPFQEVEIDSLDNFVLENKISEIDFIKIDTENYELEILIGAEKTFNSLPISLIHIEITNKNLYESSSSSQEIYNLLQKYGFRKFYIAETFENFKMIDFKNKNFLDLIVKR